MKTKVNLKIKELNIKDDSWKEKNEKYLVEIQKFLDKVENIEDEELKQSLIYQMLKCDEILTNISKEMFNMYYIKGREEAKKV